MANTAPAKRTRSIIHLRNIRNAALAELWGRPFLHLFLAFLIAVLVLPFIWFVSVALRPKDQVYQLFPSSITFENFVDMFVRVPQMVSYYADSLIITGFTVLIVVVVATLAGYAFARLRFPGRDAIFWAVVFTMFLPPVMAITSLYVELFTFYMIDTRIGLILVYTGWHLGLSTFIMRSVFASIPKDLEDAAKVDGASAWTILWRIMFPLGAGGAVVAALFTFVPVWGEYVFAFTFAGDAVRPMSIGIRLFQPHASDPEYSFTVASAAALVMFIPSIAIYVFMQRWFTKGLMEGALKG